MPLQADTNGRRDDTSRISKATLSELARIVTGDGSAVVSSWKCAPVRGGFGGAIGGTALYRYALALERGGAATLILKVLHPHPGETERSPYYWKREYEIARAGLLADLPAGSFLMPRIYMVEDYGESCWIWMEDIADGKGDWHLEVFADVAERLGRFNGAWLCGADLPRAAWLSQSWHAAIAPALADCFKRLDELLERPLVQLALPCEAAEEIKAIWREREIFRRALAQLPRTFCHFDAFRRNVLYRGQAAYLIDWALAGIGGPGEDLVSLVAVSLYYAGYTQAYARELDDVVFAAYLRGLRDAGWRGDRRLARIGYACGMTLRGLAGVKQDIGQLLRDSDHDEVRATHDMDSIEDIARLFADIRRFRLLEMAREARSLLGL